MTNTPEGAATRMTDETEPLLKDIERILDDESAFIARPSKAVSVRIALAAYMAAQKKITETVKDVFARIEPTICDTFKMCDDGPVSSREGRISERDFDALTAAFTEAPLRSLAADLLKMPDGVEVCPHCKTNALAIAERERDEARAANNVLLAFWHEVREHEGQCTENDFWDWSLNLGLMRIEPYDPARHGENDCDLEPGDDWHMCTDITKRRPALSPAPTEAE